MYYPILRSRQFELIALRELVEKKLISNYISPIVEPVKPTYALTKTLKLFHENDLPISIVINPEYGTLKDDLTNFADERFINELSEVLELKNVKLVYRLSRQGDDNILLSLGKEQCHYDYLLIDSQDIFENVQLPENKSDYVIHPDERPFRRGLQGRSRIVLEDVFTNYPRNVDYAKTEDQSFSDWHLYYQEEGYVGFSDYSIVGNLYSEAGFAPRAVTIHMVYPDSNNKLRIRHFVSDTNDSISDTAGKFGEALNKLVVFFDNGNLKTYALQELKLYHESKKFPGLGMIKKLSIMHHFELINRYLRCRAFDANM